MNLILHNDRILIPKKLQKPVLAWIHENYMHPGVSRMCNILTASFYWTSMHKDASTFVKKCMTCAKHKVNSRQYGKLSKTTIQDNIQNFEVIALDLQGPFPISVDSDGVEYNNLLTIIDIHSRWVELIPLSNVKSATIAQAVDDWWFCRYPRPRMVLSDQGPNLKAVEVQELFKSYGVNHHFTTTYSATANSIVERLHGSINQILRIVGMTNWHTKIQAIAFALRASVHTSLGQSPSETVFGLDMVLPLLNIIMNRGNSIRDPSKRVQADLDRHNKNRIAHIYKKTDLVFLRKSPNFIQNKWDVPQEGPYLVTEVHKNNTLTIMRHGILERVNLRRVIPWKGQDVIMSHKP